MTPWRILIADDEPKIRAGLRAQIERMGLPAVVCGEAEDGEIALELAETLRPDIVLVDINMPFMNGLDFIKALNRTRPGMRVIVITGYEKFEYARAALDMNVLAYLLKPIDLDELRRVLRAAMDSLEAERAHNRHFEWAISQINARRSFLREEFLRDAVAGRLEADEIRDFGVYFDFPRSGALRLMLISVRGVASGDKPWSHILRQYTLQDALEADLPAGLGFHCLFTDDRGDIAMLYEAPDGADETVRAAVRDALRSELGVQARVEVEPVEDVTALADAYDAAMERLTDRAALSPVVDAAKAYIAEHYADSRLELTEVARSLSIHPVYLSRLMKQELGMPFARYLTHVRIGRAVELMNDPDRKIWQVAEQVGYNGANYFSAAFKKVLGVSPAEYRTERKQS
ncbi:MAG: response regulator [Clostridia bacterium]|nr:response regulator [Clostridia bacterium]